MIPQDGLAPGRTRDFPALKAYAQQMGFLEKGEKDGWVFCGDHYPTLGALWDTLRDDYKAFDAVREAIVANLLPDIKSVDPGTTKMTFKRMKFKSKPKATK